MSLADEKTPTEAGVEALTLNSVEQDDDFVDPWNVESKSDTGVDYDKLIREWKYCVRTNQHRISCNFINYRTFRQLQSGWCNNWASWESNREAGAPFHSTGNLLLASWSSHDSEIKRRRQTILLVHGTRSVVWVLAFGPFGAIHFDKVSSFPDALGKLVARF